MNVMIYNKYKEMLMGLDIDVMKSIEGVFDIQEIIDAFTNFYYDKMILDITSIKDYQNFDNLQKLAVNINMENVILLLDDSAESDTKAYLSKLISLGIYNFTKNAEGIRYLLVHPNTYKDVASIHDLSSNISEEKEGQSQNQDMISTPASVIQPNVINVVQNSPKFRIIGFKNVTQHAGATSLIYMLKKTIQNNNTVVAIEVDKKDFQYFNDPDMISTTSEDLPKELMKKQNSDIILVDLNSYNDVDVCTEVVYLFEPSTLKLNKALHYSKKLIENIQDRIVVLNQCLLDAENIALLEYESKLHFFDSIPPLNDREERIEALSSFVNKLLFNMDEK